MDEALENFCIQTGVPTPVELATIRSGRNSAVFKVSSQGNNWILKKYYRNDADKRNRLDAEYKFLTFLNNVRCDSVAKPIASNQIKHLALYSFLNGDKPTIISDSHIDKATEFILKLYRLKDHPKTQALNNAADACFELEQHIEIVNVRFKQFNKINPSCNESIAILEWVKNVLEPTWLEIRSKIAKAPRSLAIQQTTLSPSDFGFHNTLDYQGTLSFIDFEYAGWDSMVKLVCDFICQPELPISRLQGMKFLTKLARETCDLNLFDQVDLLLPLHRVKWCCILLNVIRDVDRQRRNHSGAGSLDILSKQLSKAKCYYDTQLQNLR